MAEASRDGNFVTTLLAVSSTGGTTPVAVYADPTTHRLLVDSSGGSATTFQTDTFTATNNQTLFAASQTNTYTVGLYLNGLLQTPTEDYTTSGTGATLTSGVPAGTKVVWVYTT